MLYNQPFDQPSSPNAPYVNGNPATGTPGSIPPAPAIEYPQREIVRVITDVALAAPTNADLTQLSAAVRFMRPQLVQDTGIPNQFSVVLNPAPAAWVKPLSFFVQVGNTNTSATVTCAIAGLASPVNIVKLDGTPPAIGDFQNGSVYLVAFDGTYLRTLTPLFSDWFINSAVVKKVHGAGADFPDLITAFAWVAKYVITETGSVTFNVAAGQFSYGTSQIVLGHPNSNRITVNGANLLTAPPTSAAFPVTGSASGNRSTDRANQLTALRAIYATELDFSTSGGGITTIQPGSTWTNILAVGDRTGSGALFTANATTYVANISAHESGGNGIEVNQGTVDLISGVLSGSGGGQSGITCAFGACIEFDGGAIYGCSNDTFGMYAESGMIFGPFSGSAQANGNGQSGAYVLGGSGYFGVSTGFTANANAVDGLLCYQGTATVAAATLTNNGTAGAWATEGGNIMCETATFSGNGTWATYAAFGSRIDATSATGVSSHSSPSVNTNGNQNSYITN